MQKLSQPPAIYYGLVIILSSIFISVLITLLDWPLMAEAPLAACIFIQILAMSKRVYGFWSKQKRYSFSLSMDEIKAYLFEGHTTSKEGNSRQYNHHRSASEVPFK